jgi:hypothetical protein
MQFFLVLALTLFSAVSACVSGSCKNGMCSDIPSNNEYYLTSFCDKSVACGKFSGNCNEYYAADYSRFGCNSMSKSLWNNISAFVPRLFVMIFYFLLFSLSVSCCKGSNCVNLKVIDGGPGCSVEDSAHKQIVDASYSTCKHFTGSTSCGWSDKIKVVCRKTSYTVYDTSDYLSVPKIPLGPCSYNQTFATETNVPICGGDVGLF